MKNRSDEMLNKDIWYRLIHAVLISILATTFVSCSEDDGNSSDVKDLVYDKNQKNVALLFGVPDNLPGVRIDMVEMEKLFKSPEFGFSAVYAYQDKSPQEITQLTAQHVKEVGDQGTLLWYWSGHGLEDGSLYAYGGTLNFNNVTNAIKQNRNAPLKRFVAIIDACFSGNLVDGNGAITNGGGPVSAGNSAGGNSSGGLAQALGFGLNGDFETEDEFRSYEKRFSEPLNNKANYAIFNSLKPYAGTNSGFGLASATLYEQLLVFSSSRKTETSGDTPSGGEFTSNFRAAISSLRSNSSAKISDLVQTTISRVQGHTPVYRAEPDATVMNDLLFGSTTPPSDNGPTPPDTVTPPANTNGSSLFLALEQNRQTDDHVLFVGAGADITRVSICGKTPAECKASPQDQVDFKFAGNAGSRKVFHSTKRMLLRAGATYTILGYGASGLVSAQGIQFTGP